MVYKKSTGKIVGFVGMGNVNEEISQFQTKFEDSECQGEESIRKKVAKYVVRGIYYPNCAIQLAIMHPLDSQGISYFH